MKKITSVYIVFGILVIAIVAFAVTYFKMPPTPAPTQNPPIPAATASNASLIILKDVGEPQFDHFGLTEQDFQIIADANFTHITENFDLCADSDDVEWYLDMATKHQLKVILMAGAGEAEWGYACDGGPYSLTQKPVWQKELVARWINQWKNHPALFAWDISNEAGLNFPNGENNPQIGENWGKNAITLGQLKQAADDVKAADPAHPRMVRMSGYVFYENTEFFFEQKNPFSSEIAELVMVNAYSNTEDYDPGIVTDITTKAQKAIFSVDPQAQIIYSLGVWHEPPIWHKPALAHVQNDYQQLNQHQPLSHISYYRYGARTGSDWYFPDPQRGDPQLWQWISNSNQALIMQ